MSQEPSDSERFTYTSHSHNELLPHEQQWMKPSSHLINKCPTALYLHCIHANMSRVQVGAADGGSGKVFVIDEIGKMELFSQSFIRAVRQALESSSCTILGTIPIPKGKPLGLVEEVRSRRDVKVFTVSTNTSTRSGYSVYIVFHNSSIQSI